MRQLSARMLTICIASIVLLVVLRIPSVVYAHGSEARYVKINGVAVLDNPILNIASSTAFSMGVDMASVPGYPVGQPITFDVDEQLFPNTEGASLPAFEWNFADGTQKTQGQHVSHTFTKPGTYIVELAIKPSGKTQDVVQVDTIQLSIFPSKEYMPPVAKIKVNGKIIADPQRDIVPIQPVTPIIFDASGSTGNSIVWDFGDGKESKKRMTTHRYSRNEYLPVAVLRVTDANNIMTDTYVQLDMPPQNTNPLVSLYFAVSDFITGFFYKE